MPSIHDVAREAKVAPSTVSLVANGKGKVSSKTRLRVEEAIRKLAYRPTPRRQERHVAVLYTPNMLVDGKLVQFCREWIKGIREGFESDGFSINIFAGQEHYSKDTMFQQSLEGHDFDGLILMGINPSSGYLDRAVESGLPTVAFNRLPQRGEFSSVSVDAFGLGRTAAKHLMEHGHEKIAVVIQASYAHNRECLNGALQTMQQQGLAPTILWDGSQPPITAAQLAQQMIDQGVTGLVSGDPLARDVGEQLLSHGCSIPEQFSLVGNDDMGFELSNGHRLTSVGYSKHLMGELAGKMLTQLLNSRGMVVNMSATVNTLLEPGQTVSVVPSS